MNQNSNLESNKELLTLINPLKIENNYRRIIEILTLELSSELVNIDSIESEKIPILLELLTAHFNLKNFEEAGIISLKLIQLGTNRNENFWKAKGYEFLGKIARTQTQFEECIKNVLVAIDIYSTYFTNENLTSLYIELGISYRMTSECDKAIMYYNQAVEYFTQVNDIDNLAKTYGNIGNVYTQLEMFEDAFEYQNLSLEKYLLLDNKDGIATAYGNLSMIYTAKSQLFLALEFNHKSLSVFEEENLEDGILFALNNLASIYIYLEDYENAEIILDRALIISKKLKIDYFTAVVYENLGTVKYNLGEYKTTILFNKYAIKLFKKTGSSDGIGRSALNLIGTYNKINDKKNAYKYIELAGSIFGEIDTNLLATELKEKKVNYYIQFGTKDEKKLIEPLLQKVETEYEVSNSKPHLKSFYFTFSTYYKTEENWEKCYLYFQKFYETEKEISSEKAKQLSNKVMHEQILAEEAGKTKAIDEILQNILPKSIAERLKNNERTIVEKHKNISVFFSDIAGFTSYSQEVTPEVLLMMLNTVFTEFDSLAFSNSVEKIKTIGDAYMAVCGAPEENKDHQIHIARFALAVRDFMIRYRKITKQDIHIRIGLHCGEAISGVLGTRKFAYDLWGDTINTASRMESHGEAGKIHISESFADSICHSKEFSITLRGEMVIKGKGKMKTYWLDSN